MADGNAKTGKGIEDLLKERERYELWLDRLDQKGADAPDSVRSKVRADYESRLDRVMDELRTHQDSVAEQLAELRVAQADLSTQEAEAKEELAEAEVRHDVGEYDDDAWEEIKSAGERGLDEILKELERVNDEIANLAEVQALIAAPSETAPAPAAAPQAAAPAAAPVEKAQPVGAPKFTPRTDTKGKEPTAPRTLQFPVDRGTGSKIDELDFLKSVTEDEQAGPSAGRASGGFKKPAADVLGTVAEEKVAGVATSHGAAGGSDQGSQAKTLKCTECGELNRPTEWYCERCGAELASL